MFSIPLFNQLNLNYVILSLRIMDHYELDYHVNIDEMVRRIITPYELYDINEPEDNCGS